MERTDDLQNGLYIIQDTDMFMFGTDSVLLSKFIRLKKKQRILDLGTGTGVLCFLLYGRCKEAFYTGIDIQQQCIDLAKKSRALNKIESGIEFFCTDLKDFTDKEGFDIVCSNPPYERLNTGFMGGNEAVQKSRYELTAALEDIIACAARNLKSKGRLFIIYKAERIGEFTVLCHKYGLELKGIKPIQNSLNRPPRLLLLEAMKDGEKGVKWYAEK
ncbi:MAG: methyltransferase [Clostridia bacterium]|nr:methyltransferase [Clostridia bacterium]